MIPLYVRSFEVYSGAVMALGGVVPLEILEVILGDKDAAQKKFWDMEDAKWDQKVRQRLRF